MHIGGGVGAHQLRIAVEGALPVGRVVRIGTDVSHGGIVHIDVEVAEFAAYIAAHLVEQPLAPAPFEPAEDPLAGIGEILREAHGGAPFGVGGHQQRQFRQGLQFVGPLDEGTDGPAHEDQAAHAIVPDEGILQGAGGVARFAADLDDEKLGHFLADGKLLHQRIDLGLVAQVGRIVVASCCGKQDRQQEGERQETLHQPSSAFTAAEMARPSATPARRLEATPITLPISRMEVAPTSATISRTLASSSSGESCLGR